MNSRLGGALLIALFLATVLGWASLQGVRVLVFLAAGIALALLCVAVAWFITYRAGNLKHWALERIWARDAGTHHAFGGVSLRIEEDHRHVWLDGPGLLRVLGRREPEDVLAARLSGMWRRGPDQVLMLRVDAVVQYLGHMSERDDPRIQKLRRYLERDVLHPAAERRKRA